MGNGIFPGSKFYKYDNDGNPIIVRIANIDQDKNIIRYIDNDVKWKANLDEFKSEYRMLTPDAAISFAIVNLNNDEDKDVIIAAKKLPKSVDLTDKIDDLPTIICRQMCNDIFVNITDPDRKIIGVCVSQDTCPANINFRDLLSCTGIISSSMISVYMDDTLEDILKFIDTREMDKVLKALDFKYNYYYEGISTSVKEMLLHNRFMYDYRKMFNIMEVPFHIEENSEHLDIRNIVFLSNELNANIIETYVLKYGKDIDMKSITRSYVLITSAADKYKDIYIVGYDKE